MRRTATLVSAAITLAAAVQGVAVQAAVGAVDGTFTVIGGGGAGDGQLATSVYAPAVGAGEDAQGNVYLADNAHGRVRRVDATTGLISTVAGIGEANGIGMGHTGDGGAATDAELDFMRGMAVSSAGDVYVGDADGRWVRRVDHATGVISRVAGNGTLTTVGTTSTPGTTPTETSDATSSPMRVMGMTVDNATGDVYLGDWSDTVWALHPDGSLVHVAGNGIHANTGDGGPATEAGLDFPWALAVLPNGDLLVSGFSVIRRVDHATGLISTVVGSENATTDLVDGGSATAGRILNGSTDLGIVPDPAHPGGSILVFGDGAVERTVPLRADGTTGPVSTLTQAAACVARANDGPHDLLMLCHGVAYRLDPTTSSPMTRLASVVATAQAGDRTPDGTDVADSSMGGFGGVAVIGSDVYASTTNGFVYRVTGDGLVHRFAGSDLPAPTGFPAEGTPATAASLVPQGLAAAPGGGLFVVDCPRQTSPPCGVLLAHDGVIDRYAGTGPTTPFTDGMSAADFSFGGNPRIASTPTGDLYLATADAAVYVIRGSDRTVHRVPFDFSSLVETPPYQVPSSSISITGLAAKGDGTLVMSLGSPGSTGTPGRLVHLDPVTGEASVIANADTKDVAALPDGDLVAVSGNRLLRIAPDGGTTVLAEGGTSHDGGALTDLQTLAPPTNSRPPALGPLTVNGDGDVVLANTGVGRVEVVNPGTTAPTLPALTNLKATPGTGSDVDLTWDTGALPAGVDVWIGVRQFPVAPPVRPFTPAVTAPASDGGTTLTNLTAGLKYVVSAYVADGPDAAGTDLSPASSLTVLAPGDTVPPNAPQQVQVLATGSSAQLDWFENDADVADQTIRIAAGDVPPGAGEGALVGSGINPIADATGLTPGQTYSVSVWATDFSGNVSPPGSLTFVAGSSPHLTVTGPPDHAWLPQSDVTYTMATDTRATFTCSVDGIDADCLGGDTLSLPSLRPGTQHTVVMTPQTYFGPGAAVTRHVGVDVDLPTARIGALPAFNVTGTMHVPLIARDASSGIASRDVRYRTRDRYGNRSSWHYPSAWQRTMSRVSLVGVPRGATACFSVRAHDRVGHRSAWSASRCSSVLFDDRAMSSSNGWLRGTGSRFYNGTFTATAHVGQTLTLSHVRGRRVALLVSVCPTCGRLRVTNAAGTYSRNINLSAATARRSVLIVLPLAPGTGALTLRVLSAGRLVRIDGIGVGFRY